MHAEGELVLEVGLPLLGEIDIGVERQVRRRKKDDDVDAGQSHDHPARSGQLADEPPLRPGTVGSGAMAGALDGTHRVLPEFSRARSTLEIKGSYRRPPVGSPRLPP